MTCGTVEIRPDQPREAPRGPSCEGCSHNWYSAPGGQAWDRRPHSRCLFFAANIPMVVDTRGSWRSSEIPPGCPTHAQGRLIP